MTSIPSTLPGNTRRRFPWKDGSRTLRVPLWTDHEDGQWIDGKIEVPLRLCNTPPHSNARTEFMRLISNNLARWVEWRQKRGWELTTHPKISGPFNPPTKRETDAPIEGYKWYFARARFRRVEPDYVKLEDFLEIRRRADQLGIQTPKDPLPESITPAKGDSGIVDPLKYAEERRQRLGIKRKDYLMGPLDEPMAPPPPAAGVRPL